ncbi:MAG: RHS repeat-associated core domain-containing protein [Myxococcota bacterium]
MGNRLTVQDHTGRLTSYTYDPLHRLTQESSTGGLLAARTIDHAYDAAGNRTLETIDGVPVSASFDANDRITSQGSVTYSYDDDGNTLQKSGPSGTTDYTYDELNRLVAIDGPGVTSSYAYDPDGQRIESVENGVTTRYLIDANRPYAQVIEERDGLGSLEAHLIWGQGLISQVRGGSRSFYHADGHGSVRALTDASQVVTDTYDYDAYGGLLGQTGSTPNAHRYAGEQFVEGLGGYYLRARHYEPGKGRFLTRDEFEGIQRIPISLNAFLYANANPVMGIDPSGRVTFTETQSVGVILFNLVTLTRASVSGLISGGINAVDTALGGGSAGDVARSAAYGFAFGAVAGVLLPKVPISGTALSVLGIGGGVLAASGVYDSLSAGRYSQAAAGRDGPIWSICGETCTASSRLTIGAGRYSASELRAAKYIAALGKRVRLRQPGRNRAPDGDTSDLVVDDVNWDVLTPVTDRAESVVQGIVKKASQARGVVLT